MKSIPNKELQAWWPTNKTNERSNSQSNPTTLTKESSKEKSNPNTSKNDVKKSNFTKSKPKRNSDNQANQEQTFKRTKPFNKDKSVENTSKDGQKNRVNSYKRTRPFNKDRSDENRSKDGQKSRGNSFKRTRPFNKDNSDENTSNYDKKSRVNSFRRNKPYDKDNSNGKNLDQRNRVRSYNRNKAFNNGITEKIPVVEQKEITEKFDIFSLDNSIQRVIDSIGYSHPTLIQMQAIPHIMKGEDVMGVAKTGSGKTAAFALPIINNLLKSPSQSKKQPQVLVLSPTRELAVQIGNNFSSYAKYTNIRLTVVYGGVPQGGQQKDINKGVDIIVATPGRLLDLMKQRIIQLSSVKTLVIDEADRMFDMGFIPDITKIVDKIPNRNQTLLFSATMPREILGLANSVLRNEFVKVISDQQTIPVKNIDQKMFYVENNEKIRLLEELLESQEVKKALVFSKTKHGADKLAKKLRRNTLRIETMHGDKSQNNRQKVLDNFKNNKTQVVVATDLAARGLDVDDISHVINFDLPSEPETYMHRIGRTARAGKFGTAISFCANQDRRYVMRIEKLQGFRIPIVSKY